MNSISQAPVSRRPWRGRLPEQRQADRRRRLLDAALELYGTAGYAATPVTALYGVARISPRHFYELFDDREQLLAAVYDELVAQLAERVQAANEAAPLTLEARVTAGLEAALRFVTEDPRRARIVQLEILGVSPELEAHRRSVIHLFAGMIAEQWELLAEAGEVSRPANPLVALAIVGAVNELTIEWLLSDPRPLVDQVVDALERVVLPVLRDA